MILEPGRSLVARAGVTLYTVGSVKRASATTTYVAVDGGISDNPRPALYGARYTALLANRADEAPAGPYAVAGKHCESGDLLIERVELPEPHRGDILAVPATGGYTLAMSSNYNAVPRPAAVLVRDGEATRDPPPRDDRRPARARAVVTPGVPARRAASSARILRRTIAIVHAERCTSCGGVDDAELRRRVAFYRDALGLEQIADWSSSTGGSSSWRLAAPRSSSSTRHGRERRPDRGRSSRVRERSPTRSKCRTASRRRSDSGGGRRRGRSAGDRALGAAMRASGPTTGCSSTLFTTG